MSHCAPLVPQKRSLNPAIPQFSNPPIHQWTPREVGREDPARWGRGIPRGGSGAPREVGRGYPARWVGWIPRGGTDSGMHKRMEPYCFSAFCLEYIHLKVVFHHNGTTLVNILDTLLSYSRGQSKDRQQANNQISHIITILSFGKSSKNDICFSPTLQIYRIILKSVYR